MQNGPLSGRWEAAWFGHGHGNLPSGHSRTISTKITAKIRTTVKQRARCTRCGHKGATIQHPGWGGADIGFLPFPVHKRLALGRLIGRLRPIVKPIDLMSRVYRPANHLKRRPYSSGAEGSAVPSQDGLLQGGTIGQLAGSIVERRGLPGPRHRFWSRRSLPLLLGFSLYGRRRTFTCVAPPPIRSSATRLFLLRHAFWRSFGRERDPQVAG